MSEEIKRKTVGYDMGPEDEETFEEAASPSVGLRSKSFKSSLRFRYGYRILIILILIITNFTLAYKCFSLANTVNQNLAENQANEARANEALTKAIASAQSDIQTSKQAAEDSSNSHNALLKEISNRLQAVKTKLSTPLYSEPPVAASPCPELDFVAIANKTGTDKVTGHIYNGLYDPYLKPVRCKPLKILEIGLGCNMPYGPGASYNLWLEYLPSAEIYFIEYVKSCAEKWANTNDRVQIFAGDQADRAFLKEFIETTGGEFDFIIDDGGHSMNQQITSLEVLFSALKPGGVYFLEDLLTSYMKGYGGGDADPGTTVNYIKEMMTDLMTRRANLLDTKKPLSNEITRIDCIDELCAFTKKK